MMTREQRRNVWILIVGFLVFSAVLSEVIRPGQEEYRRAGSTVRVGDVREAETAKSALANTSFQALLPTLLGVREVIASLMWVQADSYFHRGEYRPIISMVRQITAIDPHQLDVYATGAWHMAYNFMDKRLIENGIEFLEEGCKNNDSVYDLYFELGYMHYDKTKNYRKSVEAYRVASTRGTTNGKEIPPSYVRHQLGHALEKMGDIDQSLEQWRENLRVGRELAAKDGDTPGPAGPNVAAARHNLYITERRRNERLAAWAERDGNQADALRRWQQNVTLAQDWLKESPNHPDVTKDLAVANAQVTRLRDGALYELKPTDLNFKFTVTRIAPKKLLVEGTCDALNLSRVRVMFRDKGYEERAARSFDFKMQNCTLEWDDVSIQRGKFRKEINLDRDPADMERDPAEIYPLKADEFELALIYNPRLQAAFIQDRYGWNGEGLTARPEYLKIVTDPDLIGIIEGEKYPLRIVTKSVFLKRDDVLGKGRKVLVSAS